MYHRHFEIIDSTQIYLKDHIDELIQHNELNLISCDLQENGIGRTGNTWQFIDKSLAMSFSLKPNINLTLTPLEIGILTCQFFKNRFGIHLGLKWPNDFMNCDNKKLGGVITHFYRDQIILAGVGINIGEINSSQKTLGENFKHGIASIALNSFNQKKLSIELYQFILENRFKDNQKLLNIYNELCCHLNKEVVINDCDVSYDGIFVGVNANGAAIISKNNIQSIHISGSLTIN